MNLGAFQTVILCGILCIGLIDDIQTFSDWLQSTDWWTRMEIESEAQNGGRGDNVVAVPFGPLTVRRNAQNVVDRLGAARCKHDRFGVVHVD